MNAPEAFAPSARAFRHFFEEIGAHFLERERLLEQLQLALLSREHLLSFGPPGTAKSQLALSVMRRIVDERSGSASVFSKQIAETTVQSDLVGPVDFKVLTRTGRTEHLTDEGILGAVHGILDEVFDGREMLLRSILNLLEEREHKSGHKTTVGRTECAVMTSNRYLSEVVQRNPELMLAFSDRISYVCFVPKGFARPASRAEMLRRAAVKERPDFKRPLTIQDLDVLQGAADGVALPHDVLEALERLADALERKLAEEAQKAASYRPTKYFSNRTLVKSIKALKSAVVLDATRRKRRWPLRAELNDLGALSAFFTLAGPHGDDLAVHLRTATDLRERAQLETVQIEAKAFAESLATAMAGLMGGAEREAQKLELSRTVEAARQVADKLRELPAASSAAAAKEAAGAAKALAGKLSPSPRYHENVQALRGALDRLLDGLAGRLAGLRVAEADLPAYLESAAAVVGACGFSGAHSAGVAKLVEAAMGVAEITFDAIAGEQQAARFRPALYDTPEKVAEAAAVMATRFATLEQAAAELATLPDAGGQGFRAAAAANREARRRCAVAFLQSLKVAIDRILAERGGPGQPSLDAPQLSASLAEAEAAVRTLDPTAPLVREVVALEAWKRDLRGAMVVASDVSALHDALAGVVAALAVPWSVVGHAVAKELPDQVTALARARARASAETRAPEALSKHYPRFLKAFPDRQGELVALKALRDQLGAAASYMEVAAWDAAAREAAAADVAAVEAAMRVLASWVERLEEKVAENPEPAWRLNVVYESKLPQLLYLDGALPRVRGLLAVLEAAKAEGVAALRATTEATLKRAEAFCEGLVSFPKT